MTDEQRVAVLEQLNDICPDTFDEGPFAPWKFTALTRNDDRWTLSFENSEGRSSASFTFQGDAVDANGIVAKRWFTRARKALNEWERDR